MPGGAANHGGGGAQFAAQLARVTERHPRVTAVRAARALPRQLHLAVKLRANLVQYIVSGVVTCVLKSLEPIVDVCGVASECGDSARQILVAVASGTVWRVTLPTKPMSALQHVLLQAPTSSSHHAHSSVESIGSPTQVLDLMKGDPLTTQDAAETRRNGASCRIEKVSDVPGVQSVRQCGDCTVCTSVLAPTTLLFASDASSALTRVEVEALEAEQSTCVIALQSSDCALAQALVEWLAPSASRQPGAPTLLLVLQGDVDGAVRYYVTSRAAAPRDNVLTAQLPLAGTLVEMHEPIQCIMPFATSSTASRGSFGLLVVGVRGAGRVLLPRAHSFATGASAPPAAAVDDLALAFEVPVHSVAYIAALDCVVYCARGVVRAFRLSDVLSHGRQQHTTAPLSQFASELLLPASVVALAVHDDTNALSLVFASGRVVSMDEAAVRRMIDRVLPSLPAADPAAASISSKRDDGGANSDASDEARIKSLLQRISHISTTSTALRAQSRQLDDHLRDLHAALELQRQVEADGAQALFHCRFELALVSTGALARTKVVQLTCRIDATPKLELGNASLACWLVSIRVRSRSQLVTTFVVPLRDVLHGAVSPLSSHQPPPQQHTDTRTMVLDDDTLMYQDSGGVLFASCSLVFQPGSVVDTLSHSPQQHALVDSSARSCASTTSNDTVESTQRLFSFSIPLVVDKACYLVQLSELLPEADVPTSATAIRAAFRQAHDVSLPAPTLSSPHAPSQGKREPTGSTLLQGFQLWSALAEHWHDKAFASVWLRDLAQSAPRELSDAQSLDVAPPSRFTMVFPAFALRELTLDQAVAVVRSVLNFPKTMTKQLRASCRSQGGRFYVGVQTFAANVVVLRLGLADGTVVMDGEVLRPLEVAVQCSSADDLSVMRALLLENVPRCPGHDDMAVPLDEVFAALSLEAAAFRSQLDEAEALATSVTEKVARTLGSRERNSLCTDEVVRLLGDLARVETQTLALYWQSRHVLNKFVI